MPVRKSKRSPYHYEVRFWIAGREVRRSSGTHSKEAAEEYEQKLRGDLWRQIKLGEKHYTWDDAVAQLTAEDRASASWERTERALAELAPMLAGARLDEITRRMCLKIRDILSRKIHNGKPVSQATVNRVLAVLRIVLNRSVNEWKLLDVAPKVPLFRVKRRLPIWATRQQVVALLNELPEHSCDMSIVACSTGMRKSEVARIKPEHVDISRRTLFVPPEHAKNGEARVVPLNADALAVLTKWMKPRPYASNRWRAPRMPHADYVFSYRGRAPIKQLSTRKFRASCRKVGLPVGFSFHKLRHSWASWHAQDGTPLVILKELGGWKSYEMVLTYAHLSPGHLAEYADRSLIGDADSVRKPEHPEHEQKRRA